MNETLSTLEPAVLLRFRKNRKVSHELRKEVHDMLRDVAFVLEQTRRVREEILEERPSQESASEESPS